MSEWDAFTLQALTTCCCRPPQGCDKSLFVRNRTPFPPNLIVVTFWPPFCQPTPHHLSFSACLTQSVTHIHGLEISEMWDRVSFELGSFIQTWSWFSVVWQYRRTAYVSEHNLLPSWITTLYTYICMADCCAQRFRLWLKCRSTEETLTLLRMID